MDVRSFNVTPVSHFVYFFKKRFSIFKCISPKKKNFKPDEQKMLNKSNAIDFVTFCDVPNYTFDMFVCLSACL